LLALAPSRIDPEQVAIAMQAATDRGNAARQVLFLAQRVPYPPDRGDRITTWNILRAFLERGDRVRVLAFAENDADVEAIQELERRGCEIIAPRISPTWRRRLSARHLLGKQPITLPYFRHPELDQAMARWVHETRPDLVFGYSSSMGQYILRQLPALEGVPKVMQFAELDSDKWRQYAASSGALGRWVYGREARLLLEFERELARQMDLNFVVSDIERELFEREIPGAPCAVLTNGVDLEAFRPAEEDAREPHTLIFTGVMDYRPNLDSVQRFVQGIWPALREEWPDARFLVVGKNVPPELKSLHGKDGIETSGWVPSTLPWFDRASIAVVPMRIARGVQNKVLESMACGLPTVVSPKAFEGIDAIDREEILVADTDADFIREIQQLLREPEQARQLGQKARQAMEQRYSWSAIHERLEELIAGIPTGH
jgi:sugar transferase (PEP-CTERM/EpsH1 system associated)